MRLSLAIPAVILAALAGGTACQRTDAPQPAPSETRSIPPQIQALADARLALLRSNDPAVRQQGAIRLAMMGPLARGALPSLRQALADPDSRVRLGAVMALGAMGSEAHSAAASVRTLLEDADSSVRLMARNALLRIERDDNLTGAIKDLGHSDEQVRHAAALTLSRLAPDAEEAVPALIAALKDERPAVRFTVLRALTRMAFVGSDPEWSANPIVIQALNGSVDDPDPGVRALLAGELTLIRTILNAGDSALVAGNLNGTIAALSWAIRRSRDQVGALVPLGMAYSVQGNHQAALDAFDDVVALLPRSATALSARGKILARQGAAEDAMVDFSRALYHDTNQPNVYFDRAQLYMARDEYDLTLEDLGAVLRLTRDTLQRQLAHVLRAQVYTVTNDPERGLEEAARAIEIDSSFGAAHYARGLILEGLGRTEEAAQAYRRFADAPLGVDPAHVGDAWLTIRKRLGYPREPGGQSAVPRVP